MNYENLEFDIEILETDNKKIHSKRLKIVSDNLTEFNKRNTQENDIKYKYHKRKYGYFGKEKFMFDRVGKYDYSHNTDFYFTPNWFIYISSDLLNFSKWLKNYSNRIDSHFHQQLNLFGKGEIDLFVKLFKRPAFKVLWIK